MNQITRYRANSNQELAEYLKRKGIIKSSRVFEAMCFVDRSKYVNNYNPYNDAYIDAPQNIGHGRTISAPHMHALVLENLIDKLTNGKRALLVRCSTGYLTTCMAILLGPNGFVVNVESDPEFYQIIKNNIENNYSDLLTNNQVQLVLDFFSFGCPSKAPYDVIYIGAAAAEVPQAFIDQLANDGRLIMPVGSNVGGQTLMQIDKTIDGKIERKSLMNVAYGFLSTSEASGQSKGRISTSVSKPAFWIVNNNNNKEKLISTPPENKSSMSNSEEKNIAVIEKSKHVQNIKNLEEIKEHNKIKNQDIQETKHVQDIKNVEEIKEQIKIKNRHTQETTVNGQINQILPTLETKLERRIDESMMKYCQIEDRIVHSLEQKIEILKKCFEEEVTEQKLLIYKIDDELKSITGKCNKRTGKKIESIEKDIRILERKLNKKMVKVKGILEERINNELEEQKKHLLKHENVITLITKDIRLLETSIKEKVTEEKTDVYRYMDQEFRKQWDEIKSKITFLKNEIKLLQNKVDKQKVENRPSPQGLDNRHNYIAFYTIIILHAALAISKRI